VVKRKLPKKAKHTNNSKSSAQNATKTKGSRARRQNWFDPKLWPMIARAGVSQGYRVGEMTKELRKIPGMEDIFASLHPGTIYKWLTKEEGKDGWSDETLGKVQKWERMRRKEGPLGRPRALVS
jgi:hypothetical protein